MSYSNMTIEWTDLIKFTSEGIVVADYPQIRIALTNKFKQIYGDDIDVSTLSADGIYLETLSLMINNIMQNFKQLYANLDIRTASGTYLDMLCALSNVTRKAATASSTSLLLTLDSEETDNYVTTQIQFIDKSGKTWTARNQDGIILVPGVQTSVTVTCDELGPIRADAGWIDRTVESSPMINVVQSVAADLGSYTETDTELKARQHNSGNSIGQTVLESLAGALLQINGIEDVLIYNNDTGVNWPNESIGTHDGNAVQAHSIYVLIRKAPNISIADSVIGNIIYDKLTPGIRTNAYTGGTAKKGIAKSFLYTEYIAGQPSNYQQYVYWKELIPVNPDIAIYIKKNMYFDSAASITNSETVKTIAQNVMNYVNNLHISELLQYKELEEIVKYSDPMFRGKNTFSVQKVAINSVDNTDYQNSDTYFNYTSFTASSENNDIVEIHLS